jgi:hypothetical protein
LRKNDLITGILAALGLGKKPETFAEFRDPIGNFTISFPSGWKFDRDLAVVDGEYTVSLASPDGRRTFNVCVNAGLKKGFDFAAYAKSELGSPSSGVYTPMKPGKYLGMPSFTREYIYTFSGTDYFAGGVMFFTGRAVFSVSWNAPEKERSSMGAVFGKMLQSLTLLQGMARPAIRP